MTGRPDHLPTEEDFDRIGRATAEAPLGVLISACLAGEMCGWDGKSYGDSNTLVGRLLASPRVRVTRFCPEDFSFGTPRAMSNIHGGNGFDVLNGRARVLTEKGVDWTDGMIAAADRMAMLARKEDIGLAILMDISAACGSQVIYDGHRFVEGARYQRGPGVAAARLIRAGIPVVSQRDYASLARIFEALGVAFPDDVPRRDHHETDWYRDYFVASE